MDLSAASVPISMLKSVAAPTTQSAGAAMGADEATKRAHIDKSAKEYEGAFLSIMLGQMMSGVKTSTFGGGEGEDAFKSFLTDAMAKSMVKHGGVGLSRSLSNEMLKMQGLAPAPTATAMKVAA